MTRNLIEILVIGLLLSASGSVTIFRISTPMSVTKDTAVREAMQTETLTLASVTATMIYLILFFGQIARLMLPE